jgi:hypothetical protein
MAWLRRLKRVAPTAPSQAVARKLGSALAAAADSRPFESSVIDIWGQTKAKWLARR